MASDADTNIPNWLDITRERNGLTDFQPFRLFFEGKTDQNEYRPIGVIWWLRNSSISNKTGFVHVGNAAKITGSESSTLRGVRPSV